MSFLKRLLLVGFILVLSFSRASAQDTISVFFNYGSSKVKETEARKLRVLHTNYDLRDVEYANFFETYRYANKSILI